MIRIQVKWRCHKYLGRLKIKDHLLQILHDAVTAIVVAVRKVFPVKHLIDSRDKTAERFDFSPVLSPNAQSPKIRIAEENEVFFTDPKNGHGANRLCFTDLAAF